MKLLTAVLLALLMTGCSDITGYKTVGPWQQSGSVALTYVGGFSLDYKDSANVLRTLNGCHGYLSNPLQSMKAGMIVDIRFRLRNEYDTIYEPCAEIDNVKIISGLKEGSSW